MNLAPHLRSEKELGNEAPPGFPSIEYMLPLLLTAVRDGRLTMDDLKTRLYDNPRRIFKIPMQPNTYIEVDMSEEWTISEEDGFSKAGWTPYAGRKVCGKVRSVVIRGEEVYVDGVFVEKSGSGRNLFAEGPTVEREEITEVSGKSL